MPEATGLLSLSAVGLFDRINGQFPSAESHLGVRYHRFVTALPFAIQLGQSTTTARCQFR